ncbi:hypothetical protein CJF42_01205 [Pseudoalteromonas sp. NBT06-2]|uniref:transposase family protein n=1 Tax=Pseudoalteromonas sp. NBT06-2 TaxID=2025950 RepID=UPI000BA5B76F|nr:hypothetical protein CJF42_01205 [Pseudoalteromonas sp. NBT06-2]
MTKRKPTLIEHFKDITDPRIQRKQLHILDDIFFITLCAVICGAIAGLPLKHLQK